VRGVSFQLGHEKLAIVGESGSGKSTVGRALHRDTFAAYAAHLRFAKMLQIEVGKLHPAGADAGLFRFVNGSAVTHAVRGVSFQLGHEKLAIVGESGSGNICASLRCCRSRSANCIRLALTRAFFGCSCSSARPVNGSAVTHAVRGVSFQLGHEKLAIVGESGSGKSHYGDRGCHVGHLLRS
jgi:ABC-type dipeptide/oligopeptide/nickel transport system ATPase component